MLNEILYVGMFLESKSNFAKYYDTMFNILTVFLAAKYV